MLLKEQLGSANREKTYLADMLSDISHQIKTPLTAITIMTDLLKQLDISAILRSVCQSLELLAEIRGVELSLQQPREKIMVDCDHAWTAEAFSNIIKNCVEHTQAGGSVSVSVMQNNFGTSVTIEDNGDGIAGEDLPYIFERFYKGKHGSRESVGIGLALARQIILRQNGTIQVQSTEGGGE